MTTKKKKRQVSEADQTVGATDDEGIGAGGSGIDAGPSVPETDGRDARPTKDTGKMPVPPGGTETAHGFALTVYEGEAPVKPLTEEERGVVAISQGIIDKVEAAVMKLDPRERRWLVEFIKTGSRTEACRRAGYSILTNPMKFNRNIREAHQAIVSDPRFSPQRVFDEMEKMLKQDQDPRYANARAKMIELLGKHFVMWDRKQETEEKSVFNIIQQTQIQLLLGVIRGLAMMVGILLPFKPKDVTIDMRTYEGLPALYERYQIEKENVATEDKAEEDDDWSKDRDDDDAQDD